MAASRPTFSTTYKVAPFLYRREDPADDDDEVDYVALPSIRQLLFVCRVNFIRRYGPNIARSEEAFNTKLAEIECHIITASDRASKTRLYQLEALGPVRPEVASTLLWSGAWKLSTGADSLPCTRCEFLHKSMWNGDPRGAKSVSWKRSFMPMNCGEPLALTLALMEKEVGDYYT